MGGPANTTSKKWKEKKGGQTVTAANQLVTVGVLTVMGANCQNTAVGKGRFFHLRCLA